MNKLITENIFYKLRNNIQKEYKKNNIITAIRPTNSVDLIFNYSPGVIPWIKLNNYEIIKKK